MAVEHSSCKSYERHGWESGKSVSQAIAASCQVLPFTEEQWRTNLAEIVYLVNSKPPYWSSSNRWEEPPITPNDRIIGVHVPLPLLESEEPVSLRDLYSTLQQKVTEFWYAWQKYFASTLLQKNKCYRPRDNLYNLKKPFVEGGRWL